MRHIVVAIAQCQLLLSRDLQSSIAKDLYRHIYSLQEMVYIVADKPLYIWHLILIFDDPFFTPSIYCSAVQPPSLFLSLPPMKRRQQVSTTDFSHAKSSLCGDNSSATVATRMSHKRIGYRFVPKQKLTPRRQLYLPGNFCCVLYLTAAIIHFWQTRLAPKFI